MIGASAGIGAGIARRVAAEGADVHLAARRLDKLAEHVDAIRAAGGRATAHACDLESGESVATLFDAVARDGAPVAGAAVRVRSDKPRGRFQIELGCSFVDLSDGARTAIRSKVAAARIARRR